MQKTVLSVLHNIKDYQYYDNSAMPLQKDDADILIAFLEQEDVQKCIPKVPKKFGNDPFACPTCNELICITKDKPDFCWKCNQKLKWVEENNEKAEHVGSKIFDNFDVTISKFPNSITSTSKEEVDSSKENR